MERSVTAIATRTRFLRTLLISLPMGVILGVVLGRYHIRPDVPAILLCLVLLLPCLYLQVILHELGHFLMGRLVGFRLFSFRVFGFVLERENDRFTLRFRKNFGNGGLCMMFPVRSNTSRWQSIGYFSGGLLMHLLSVIVCLLVLRYARILHPLTYYILYINLGLAPLLLVGNAVPFISKGNVKSDGRQIINALRNNTDFRYQQQLFFLSAKSMSGIRPAALGERDWLDVAAIPDASTKVSFLVKGYYHYFDAGRLAEALQCIRKAEIYLADYPLTLQPGVQSELLFAAMVLEGDTERVARWYAIIQADLEQKKTLPALRLKAAYSWYVQQDALAAEQYISQAHTVANSYIVPGFIPFEQSLLVQLSQCIAQGSTLPWITVAQ